MARPETNELFPTEINNSQSPRLSSDELKQTRVYPLITKHALMSSTNRLWGYLVLSSRYKVQ